MLWLSFLWDQCAVGLSIPWAGGSLAFNISLHFCRFRSATIVITSRLESKWRLVARSWHTSGALVQVKRVSKRNTGRLLLRYRLIRTYWVVRLHSIVFIEKTIFKRLAKSQRVVTGNRIESSGRAFQCQRRYLRRNNWLNQVRRLTYLRITE